MEQTHEAGSDAPWCLDIVSPQTSCTWTLMCWICLTFVHFELRPLKSQRNVLTAAEHATDTWILYLHMFLVSHVWNGHNAGLDESQIVPQCLRTSVWLSHSVFKSLIVPQCLQVSYVPQCLQVSDCPTVSSSLWLSHSVFKSLIVPQCLQVSDCPTVSQDESLIVELGFQYHSSLPVLRAMDTVLHVLVLLMCAVQSPGGWTTNLWFPMFYQVSTKSRLLFSSQRESEALTLWI